MSRRRRILEVAALASISIAACSSQGNGTNPGDGVVTGEANLVIWRSNGGGFGPPIPAGASCHFESAYSLNLHGGELAWSLCKVAGTDFSDPSAYSTVDGSRVLTAEERTHALATAAAVKVSNVTTCGADLDSRSLEVDGTSGTVIYGDDFYACSMLFDQYVYTAQLESLREVLDGLAHNP